MTDYLQLARDVVASVTENVEVEAYILDELLTEIRIDRGEVEQFSQSGSKWLGVRVIDNGRVGYAYTSDFSETSLRETVQTALELAQVATPDENRVLPEPQPIPDEDLEIYDAAFSDITPEQKIDFAMRAERAALDADSRMIQAQVNYGDSITRVSIANSKGLAAQYSRTAVWSWMIGVARTETDAAQAFSLFVTNFFNELDPEKMGRDAARKTTMTLGATPIKTQVASVVFDPIVMAQVLGYLSRALTADAMQRGRSFLMGKMGAEIGADNVTLLDNGRMKRGIASAPFDAEGVPTSATRLIDEGVFQNVVYDSYTARKDGKQSTGNATRNSHRELPSLGMSNFYIQPGHLSQDEIIAGVERGLYVTNIMQTGGINPINGDCSMAAGGMWIEDGKLTQPVNGVTIATTLTELLKNVSAVGDDLTVLPFLGAVGAPTVRVDNMTIGGISE